MKKLLSFIVVCSLLLSACTPQQIYLARRSQASTVLLHVKLAKGDKRGWGGCSGVYVTPHVILTASHCVQSPDDEIQIKEIWVKNVYGNGAKATIVKLDASKDLALIKTSLRGVPTYLARKVRVGEDCYVIGNPLGLRFIVSKGIVCTTNVELNDPDNDIGNKAEHFITDAVVLPGSSGGPAFNSRGQLIGIVVRSTSVFGAFGASGLGIVVQINDVRDFLKQK